MLDEGTSQELIQGTSRIVAAYIGNHAVDRGDIPTLIDEIHTKLLNLHATNDTDAISRVPAVPISESVTEEHIVCLEDGLKFKMLKKHLATKYNLSPEEYRKKWNLPPEYPMVAPNYAARRQELARASGLGRNK